MLFSGETCNTHPFPDIVPCAVPITPNKIHNAYAHNKRTEPMIMFMLMVFALCTIGYSDIVLPGVQVLQCCDY